MYVHVYVILKASVVLMLGFTYFASGDKIYYLYIHVHFEAHTDPCSMSIASIVDDDNVLRAKCIACMNVPLQFVVSHSP